MKAVSSTIAMIPDSIKSIVQVFTTNVLGLIVGLINGFLIPSFLGIEEYAIYKTFGLYVSYVGVMHFGFIDGIYMNYGGMNRDHVLKSQLKAEFLFLLVFQSIMLAIGVGIGFALGNMILVLVSLSILPVNMTMFFKFFYQSTGSFSEYAKINSYSPILTLTATLTIVFIIGARSGSLFITSTVIINYLVFFLLLIGRRRWLFSERSRRIFTKSMLNTMKVGIFIMVGNLSSMFFYSMDRWFVKILLRTEDFAFYSFATSMMGMVMILVSSVAMTFYPMLVRRQEEEGLLRSLKSYLMILGAFAGAAYFGFDLIVNWILRDYLLSLEVIAILFAGFPAIAVINAIYVNMYKAQKVEKKYFFTVFGMMAISFGLNALAVIMNRSNWAIAAATTIAFYFWFFFSSKDFKGTRTNLREIAYLVGFLIVFFSTTRLLSWWIGLPLYLAGILGITLLLYKIEFLDLIEKVLSSFKVRSSAN